MFRCVGHHQNRKRVQRLMRIMGLEGLPGQRRENENHFSGQELAELATGKFRALADSPCLTPSYR